MAMTPLIRITDDDARVRESVAFLLRLDGWETVEYESAEDFLAKDGCTRPGCLILDIRMPGMSGLELQLRLRRAGVTLPILFLTGHGDIQTAVMALKRGAADFVTKPMDPDALQAAVKKLTAWHLAVYEKEAAHNEAAALYATLTGKEKEVCRRVAAGALNKQIAIDSGISEQTVKTHRGNVMHKLGLRSAVELAAFLRLADEKPETDFPITLENDEGSLLGSNLPS